MNSGYLVKTISGDIGRTYHSEEKINGKIPVYLELDAKKFSFTEQAVLCNSETLKIIGFID